MSYNEVICTSTPTRSPDTLFIPLNTEQQGPRLPVLSDIVMR